MYGYSLHEVSKTIVLVVLNVKHGLFVFDKSYTGNHI